MIVFPHCKINIGLQVVKKRPDHYHEIKTLLYPVKWTDILEITKNDSGNNPFLLSQSGITIDGDIQSNLIYKAWKKMTDMKPAVPVKVHLHKNIPMGAGLGGGSSDAAHFINLYDQKFKLGFTQEDKIEIAKELGSDCAFFLKRAPMYATGKGDQFKGLQLDLSAYFILIVYPGIHSDTKSAYEGLIPREPETELSELLETQNLETWKNKIVNDFEPSIFKKYPEISELKNHLYQAGALYASMSGSGSSVYGIFDKEPMLTFPKNYRSFLQKPEIKTL